jgi:cyclopropane fatty-acyl-phospholipid synthase-like methyltransferase
MATTEASYLESWAKGSLGFHFGLGDESTASLAEAISNANAYLADRADIGPGTRVLDAGCGVGGSAQWLAAERRATVTGITIVPEQVAIAERLAKERGFTAGVTFRCLDMCNTDFPEASFDVVWNIESLCYVEDLDAYLDQVKRLLTDGGRFACIDLCRSDSVDLAREKTVCQGCAMVSPMRTIDEIADACRRVGFRDVDTADLTPRARRSIDALHAMAHNARPLLKAERLMLGIDNSIYQGHVDAALAMAEGMLAGSMALGHVIATRPTR